ncbi:MAG TPA: ester cyclase [Vicinamibacterales bacterium]|nr:ester cyclase [Vicinamibacterales bacterium]
MTAERGQGGPAADAARNYFGAIARQDLDAALSCWKPGGIDYLAPVGELRAPEGMREYFTGVFASFPDFRYEVLALVADGDQAAVRWRVSGTFTGKPFSGVIANGKRLVGEGCDLLRVDVDGRIVHNDSYWDDAATARQIGLLPPRGSRMERAMTWLFNVKTRLTLRGRR